MSIKGFASWKMEMVLQNGKDFKRFFKRRVGKSTNLEKRIQMNPFLVLKENGEIDFVEYTCLPISEILCD